MTDAWFEVCARGGPQRWPEALRNLVEQTVLFPDRVQIAGVWFRLEDEE